MDAALELPRRHLVALRLRLRKLKDEREQAERHWERFWLPLFATMSQEHIAHVAEEIGAHDAGECDYYSLSALTRRVLEMDLAARFGTLQGPLAMPPSVAQVFLDDKDAVAGHSCEDCGYRVPVGRSRHLYFERCPLCGGRTGWSAYSQKHSQPERQGPQAAEVEEDVLLADLASDGQQEAPVLQGKPSALPDPVPSRDGALDVLASSGWVV